VHCSERGTKFARAAQTPALSARTSSKPPNLDEIAVDNDYSVLTIERKLQNKSKKKHNRNSH
jgi:hypothetical protein